jgi:hypothetical protein
MRKCFYKYLINVLRINLYKKKQYFYIMNRNTFNNQLGNVLINILYTNDKERQVNTLKEYIENGGDINKEYIKNIRLINIAGSIENDEFIKVLVDNNCIIDRKAIKSIGYNSDTLDVMSMLITFKNTKMIEYILYNSNFIDINNDIGDIIIYLCEVECEKALRYLIDKRINLNTENGKKSPLHIAVIKKNLELTKLIVENDGNIYSLDEDNKTPIDYAEYKSDIYNYLIYNKS